ANAFGRRLSFFFYVHMDLFEEVAKFRAARRLWAKLMAERHGVTDPKAQQFRFGVVCGGSSLTASQPLNNVIRVSIENLAAVFGGAQSIFTCAYDEAFQIPTEQSSELALRTQQIIAHESGVAGSVDPLGGSYLVEELTDRMEEGIQAVIDELDDYGGVVSAIEDGYLQARIARRAKERKEMVDSGDRVVVGVNRYSDDRPPEIGEMFTLDPE
ncbi:MAG: methylmalonyl-CoA mutase, partial [Actinomycetia bacterium]|nr:methylmalonyl-CoA mutase [Actinomycetes bacterium]